MLVKHYTGLSKYRSVLFDIPAGISVSRFELIVPEKINYGDNLTVVAILNENATGNVSFTVGELDPIIKTISNGRAELSVDPELGLGTYEVVAVFNSDSTAYSDDRAVANFSVRVNANPSVTVIAPETFTNSTNISIQAFTNFDLTNEALSSILSLQFVVRNCCCFCYTFFFSNLVVY